MCYVGFYAMITQKGYERARLSAELKKAKTENEYLHAELRVLSSPDRLAAAAVSAGMIPSENVQIVRIPTSVTVAKAETGE
jgi:cell division protein FtsL